MNRTEQDISFSSTTVRAQCHIRHAQDLILSAGLDIAEVVQNLFGREALVEASHETIDLADYFRIRAFVTAKLRDETCHLSARQLLPGSTDFVLKNLPQEGTLIDVMETIATAYNLLHGGEYNKVERRDGQVVFIIDDEDFPYAVNLETEQIYFAMETTLLFLHAFLTMVAPIQSAQGLICLSVKRQQELDAPHLCFWDVPLEYGAPRYEVCYADRWADVMVQFRPTRATVDEQIQLLLNDEFLQSREDENTVSLVTILLAQGLVEQGAIAETMGISPATLRRRLAHEGQSFRTLRKQVLNVEARRLIEDGLSLTAVSERLGFSDVRSFNRAFKAWNAVTPKTYQQMSRG